MSNEPTPDPTLPPYSGIDAPAAPPALSPGDGNFPTPPPVNESPITIPPSDNNYGPPPGSVDGEQHIGARLTCDNPDAIKSVQAGNTETCTVSETKVQVSLPSESGSGISVVTIGIVAVIAVASLIVGAVGAWLALREKPAKSPSAKKVRSKKSKKVDVTSDDVWEDPNESQVLEAEDIVEESAPAPDNVGELSSDTPASVEVEPHESLFADAPVDVEESIDALLDVDGISQPEWIEDD